MALLLAGRPDFAGRPALDQADAGQLDLGVCNKSESC